MSISTVDSPVFSRNVVVVWYWSPRKRGHIRDHLYGSDAASFDDL